MTSPFYNKGDPFGIYVHWPFCAAKCPYCDFNSHVRHNPVDQDVFVEAYLREIEYFSNLTPDRQVSSIFFGGGTPSLMEPDTVGKIIDAISQKWGITPNAEITLEANPTSVEARRFKGYHQRGVNRLSLGVQSLDDTQLKFLGRQHSADEAIAAVELARQIFPRLSFDLIYANPNQTIENWCNELKRAIALAADHLSLYQLTIEQGTPFYELHKAGKFKTLDQDLAASLYEVTDAITSSHNFNAYEISNYAIKGAESIHNLVYWRYDDYVGIGPGAHGRLSINNRKVATACQRNPEIWWQKTMTDGHGMVEFEWLSGGEAADEMLLMGLRLREGIDPNRFALIAGTPLNQEKITQLSQEKFLEIHSSGKLRATKQGSMVLDALVADLVC